MKIRLKKFYGKVKVEVEITKLKNYEIPKITLY